LDLARQGGIGCILVKDLSRWGRNYIEVCDYIEQIFPFLGIRFVSVNDYYDSDNFKGSTAPMDVAFSSIMHDVFVKELSFKIRQSYVAKVKKGEHVSDQAPFGYKKSDTVKNKLVIDEEAAAVVRRIFDMAAEGMSKVGIVATLNGEGVPTPLKYRRLKGLALPGLSSTNALRGDGEWCPTKIYKILKNESYTGVQVSCRYRVTKPGSRKNSLLPESEWIKVPGMHEAIIPAELFERVNASFRKPKKPTTTQTRANLFVSKIRCGHCGRPLKLSRKISDSYYYCDGVRLSPDAGCAGDRVLVEDLKAVVLAAVKAEARKAIGIGEGRKSSGVTPSGNAVIEAELKQIKAKLAHTQRRGVSLYEEFADGQLDKDAYVKAKAALSEESAELESRRAELNARLISLMAKASEPQSNNKPLLKRIADAGKWTDDVLLLLDVVTVYDSRRIEVRFNFGDTNTLGGMGHGNLHKVTG
jgi:DNA invertase Pin-like site-specific DNA recombinase